MAELSSGLRRMTCGRRPGAWCSPTSGFRVLKDASDEDDVELPYSFNRLLLPPLLLL